MYLVFKSAYPTSANQHVLWVETSVSIPDFVTKESAFAYLNLNDCGSETEQETLTQNVFNNVAELTLSPIIGGTSGCVSVSKSQLKNMSATTRKLDPSTWNTCAPMAWARLTGTCNLLNL